MIVRPLMLQARRMTWHNNFFRSGMTIYRMGRPVEIFLRAQDQVLEALAFVTRCHHALEGNLWADITSSRAVQV